MKLFKKSHYILLFITCGLYFYDILKGGLLFTERDLSVFFIPPRILWLSLIKTGQFPLWNPYFYCGLPLFATLQPGILYPFSLIHLILPFDYAFNTIIILHFFLAAIFTYLFIRQINGSNNSALTGAIIFMLSGYLLSIHNLLPHLLSIVWLPLILMNFHKYSEKPQVKYLLYTAFFLLIMFLGGAVEITYGTFFLLFILLLFPDPFGTGSSKISFKSKVLSLVVVIIIFLLLSAVQLLPFLELAFNSIREGGLSYKEATTWSMGSRDLLQFFVPNILGNNLKKYWENQNWLKTIYLGIIPFALALFFLLEKKRKALALILIMEISLLLSFGGNTPIYKFLFKYIPFLNTIRYPVKFLFIFIFLLSIMAGLGYDSFSRQSQERNDSAKKIVLCILFFSVLAVSIWSFMNFHEASIKAYFELKGISPPEYNFVHINLHNIKRFFLFCSFLGPIIIFGWHFPQRKKIFYLALIFLLTLDLFFTNKGYYFNYDIDEFHKPSESINFLKQDKSLFRVLTSPRTQKAKLSINDIFTDTIKIDKEKISPGLNLEHKIFSIGGSEVIRIKNYEKLYSLIMTSPMPDSTILPSLLNMKYLILSYEYNSTELEPVKTIGNQDDPNGYLKIYKNLRCLPRAFLVDKYKVIRSENEYKNIFQSKEFNPEDIVLLDEDPFDKHEIISDDNQDTNNKKVCKRDNVIINNFQANKIELDVFASKTKILFLSETYYPGWRVYIDGQKSKIYRANLAFRSVPLTSGHHKIEFIYRPLSAILGMFISLISIIIVILILIFFRDKKLH